MLTQPVSPSELESPSLSRQRREAAAGQADLDVWTHMRTMPPLRPGTTVSTSPGGQTTVVEQGQPSCPSGHARVGADRFCRQCGSEFMDAGQLRVTDESRLAARDAAAVARLRAMEDLPGMFAQPSKPKRPSR